MKSILTFLRKYRSTILIILVIVLTARVFIPQLGSLSESLTALQSANLWWLLLAIVLFYSGVPIIATQLSVLTFKKLAYKLTLQVQLAALFVNKILPQGIGTISLNIYYFIKQQHTVNQAGTIMAVNAAMSLVAYIILVAGALLFSDLSIGSIFAESNVNLSIGGLGIIAVIAGVITLASSKKLRQKIAKMWQTFLTNVRYYKKRPRALVINTVLNGLGTSVNVLALLLCAQAIGIEISFADALLAYTFGNIAAAAVPTPGGIGSAEMGIYSGLVVVGVDAASAITITLLYRLISYWLSILPGYIFFAKLRRTIFKDYKTT